MNAGSTEDLLDCTAAARHLGVSVKTIRKWAQSGQLKGSKVGSRGDWRFTLDDLSRVIQVDHSDRTRIEELLERYAKEIQEASLEKHVELLDSDENSDGLNQHRKEHVESVKLLARYLNDFEKGREAFNKLGEKLAKRSVTQGLTLEQALNGSIFLKQSIWEKLNQKDIFSELTQQDLFAVMHILSVYCDILTSKLAITYQSEYEQLDILKNHNFIAVDILEDAVISKNLSGKIIAWNKAAERMFGFTAKEAIGKNITIVNPRELVDEEQRIIEKIKKGIRVQDYETVRLKKNGDRIYVSASISPIVDPRGKIIGATNISRDIHRRKLAENALKQSHEEMQAILQTSADGIFAYDNEARIVFANDIGAKFLSFDSANEILKTRTSSRLFKKVYSNFDITNESGQTYALEDMPTSKVLAGEEYAESVMCFTKKKSLEGPLWLHVRARSLRKNDEVKLIVTAFTDISELRQAQEERRRLIDISQERNELVRLNQAKDEFIGIASHQLRTPATAVKQYLYILLNGYGGELNEAQRKYLQTAYDTNDRQLRLVNDLLKTAQIDSSNYKLRRKRQNISVLVAGVINDTQPTIALRNQKVLMKGLDQVVRLYVDDAEMKLVLSNLIENASKYSHRGSKIEVSLVKGQRSAIITVKDHGVGIDREHLDVIFDKFTRVDNELSDTITGSGLGLYWVKQIVELHGGSITVKSKPKEGSAFRIKLPL